MIVLSCIRKLDEGGGKSCLGDLSAGWSCYMAAFNIVEGGEKEDASTWTSGFTKDYQHVTK